MNAAIALVTGVVGRLPVAVRIAMSAVAAFAAMAVWDVTIDDPAVRRQARKAYVAISELEKVKAEKSISDGLLALAQKKASDLQAKREEDLKAIATFAKAQAESIERERSLEDEIDELMASRTGVPTVRDLGVTGRLRNR